MQQSAPCSEHQSVVGPQCKVQQSAGNSISGSVGAKLGEDYQRQGGDNKLSGDKELNCQ